MVWTQLTEVQVPLRAMVPQAPAVFGSVAAAHLLNRLLTRLPVGPPDQN